MYTFDTYDRVAYNQAVMLNEYLKLESIHPIDIIENKSDVLHEAIISQLKIRKTLENIIEAIKKAIKKFKDITRELKTKNAEWIRQAETFDLNDANLANFREEVFPYWNSIPSKFNRITIPDFNMRDEMLYDGDSSEFMKKYFSDIIDENGDINKNILRGLTPTSKKEKEPIEYGKAKTAYNRLLDVLKSIYGLRDKITKDADMIAKTVERIRNQTAPMNESALLEYSMFKDEYFDILLEVTTPDQIEKEQEAEEKDKKINIDGDGNRKVSEVEKQYKLVAQWSKMCTAVVTAEMDVLDEAYSECIKFISKVMKSTKKDK